jgi:hypothetical protein
MLAMVTSVTVTSVASQIHNVSYTSNAKTYQHTKEGVFILLMTGTLIIYHWPMRPIYIFRFHKNFHSKKFTSAVEMRIFRSVHE